jgi:hypothetical protein
MKTDMKKSDKIVVNELGLFTVYLAFMDAVSEFCYRFFNLRIRLQKKIYTSFLHKKLRREAQFVCFYYLQVVIKKRTTLHNFGVIDIGLDV